MEVWTKKGPKPGKNPSWGPLFCLRWFDRSGQGGKGLFHIEVVVFHGKILRQAHQMALADLDGILVHLQPGRKHFRVILALVLHPLLAFLPQEGQPFPEGQIPIVCLVQALLQMLNSE